MASKDANQCFKNSSNERDVTDQELMQEFKEVKRRFNFQTSLATTTITEKFRETQQYNFFTRLDDTLNSRKKYYKTIANGIDRQPLDSLLTRSNAYREKVEKARAMEMVTTTAHVYGDQYWCLNLRRSKNLNDNKDYILPVGNSCDGLWVHMTDNPRKQLISIRNPERQKLKFKSFSDNPFVIDKQCKEHKRLSAILPLISNEDFCTIVVYFNFKLGIW